MAILKNREILTLNKRELLEKLKQLEIELLKLKVQKGQASTGTKKSKEIKRAIARIHTQLNQIKE